MEERQKKIESYIKNLNDEERNSFVDGFCAGEEFAIEKAAQKITDLFCRRYSHEVLNRFRDPKTFKVDSPSFGKYMAELFVKEYATEHLGHAEQ